VISEETDQAKQETGFQLSYQLTEQELKISELTNNKNPNCKDSGTFTSD
jgi:hypothetical protein